MYNFNEAAVVYQDIQGRLNNDWFVWTALLSLVHKPHISASSSTFFFYFFFSFFLKKRATKSPTSFPRPVRVRWRSPPLCTSLLYAHTALPLSLFLAAVRITLPHIHTASHPNIQNEKQKLKENSNRAKWKSSRKQRCSEVHRFWELVITLETKLTMAVAGWSGSISANRWLTLSVVLPCFLATKPKNLWRRRKTS